MASTNQEVQSSVMASICELFSKLDQKRYSATLKTDDGIINLQIIDKSVKKECVSSPTVHQLHPNDAATRGKGPMLKHGFPNFARGRNANQRHQNRNSAISDSNSIMNSDSTARSKMIYKSPSEKGRDRMRLNRYLHVKNRPETSDNSCQTNLTQCISPDKSNNSPEPSELKSPATLTSLAIRSHAQVVSIIILWVCTWLIISILIGSNPKSHTKSFKFIIAHILSFRLFHHFRMLEVQTQRMIKA